MGSNRVQQRVAAVRVEVRADAREVQRRTDESLSEASALRREVVAVPVAVAKTRCPVCLALINEFSRYDVAVAELDAVAPQLFVDDGELIAFTHVLNEVDVPLEDPRHVHYEAIGN